jgi:hypothetical protein
MKDELRGMRINVADPRHSHLPCDVPLGLKSIAYPRNSKRSFPRHIFRARIINARLACRLKATVVIRGWDAVAFD